MSYLFQNQLNSSKEVLLNEEDLHYFIIDPDNVKESIKLLEKNIKRRTRINKEFWLIDISALESIENAEFSLVNLYSDLDDDFFLFMPFNRDAIKIWEAYKIDPTTDLILREIGFWDKASGFVMFGLDKWKRRGNLRVSHSVTRWKLQMWAKKIPFWPVFPLNT